MKRRSSFQSLIAASVVFLTGCCAAAQGPVAVDGRFNDWPSDAPLAADAIGDAVGPFDVVEVGGLLHDSIVSLRLRITDVQNFVAGAVSTPDLLIVLSGDGLPEIEVQARGRRIIRRDTGQTVSWDAVRYASAPTFAADEFEFRLDLASLGALGAAGVSVRVEGSDALEKPLQLIARNPDDALMLSGAPRDQPADEAAGQTAEMIQPATDRAFRLVSLNTLRTGLLAPAQAPGLKRLLVAARGDVVLLQEEYNSSSTQIAQIFNEIMPLPDGAVWHVHKRGDNAIVSHWPMIELPNHDPSYAAAAVLTPDGPIVVLGVHPKCCGYIGSTEDDRRIAQTGLMRQLIEEVRAGKHDGQVALTGAPVVVGGDWNLVGSRTPLDMLTAPTLPGMEELRLWRRGSRDTITWRELGGFGFPPGRLDLIVYESPRLVSMLAQVLDTEQMSAEALAAAGLQAADSRASDHLMLIADFAWRDQDSAPE